MELPPQNVYIFPLKCIGAFYYQTHAMLFIVEYVCNWHTEPDEGRTDYNLGANSLLSACSVIADRAIFAYVVLQLHNLALIQSKAFCKSINSF